MAVRSLFFLLLLVFFSVLSGCGDRGKDNHAIVEMDVEGRVYNSDPRALIYNDVYGDSSIEIVEEDANNKDPYATYLLGTVYFSASPRHGIERDTVKGKELLEEAWGMGVVDAGYSLYQMYGEGIGVKRNLELAIYYLEESAGMGFILSQRTLAKDYFGVGSSDYLETNYQMAREWYTKAAEQGDRESGVALAKIYNNGLGVQEDDNLAFRWMLNVEAMEYGRVTFGIDGLAYYYEEGIGTDVDLVQAYKYRDLMGTSGLEYKERLSEKMTPEQIQEAIRLSGEWQREHNISMPNSEGYHYR